MNKMKFTLAIILSLIVSVGSATPVDSLWVNANKLYTEGQFSEASVLYDSILKTGNTSADLYFNLGNAYLKQNKLAEARLSYERALKLDPQNEDIEYNIDYASSMQLDKIEEVEEMFLVTWWNSLLNSQSSGTWAIISIVLFALILFFALMFIFTKDTSIRKKSFLAGILCLTIFVISMFMGSYQRSKQLNKKHAIIFTSVVTVKSTPDNSGSDLFVIHEGLKVRIIDEQGSWLRIKLGDNKSQGWVPKTSLEII